MANNKEALKNNPQVQQLINVQLQIQKNLEELNKSLISNDLLFLQLATLSKAESNQPKPETQIKQTRQETKSKSVDNPGDINASQLDLNQFTGQKVQSRNFEEEEDDTEEEDEDD